jgi:hypothetical protein
MSKCCFLLSFLSQASFANGLCLCPVNRKHFLPFERNSIGNCKIRLSSARTVSLSSNIELNPLITDIKISKTVEVFSLVKQMEENGDKVTSLCVGEPDFPPPSAVLDATIQAVRQGKTTYTAVTGTAALRQAIAHDLQSRKGVSYDPSTEIVVGNGAKQCVFQVRPFFFIFVFVLFRYNPIQLTDYPYCFVFYAVLKLTDGLIVGNSSNRWKGRCCHYSSTLLA